MELGDEEIDRHEGTGGELNVESDPVGDDAGRGTGSVEQFQEVRVFERVGVINRYERWINEIIRRAGIHECKV